MTMSFAELAEQPAGVLVYTTSNGSITFDERLSGPHHQPIWGYDGERLDRVLVRNDRAKYRRYFESWGARKHSELYKPSVDMLSQMIQPTMPLGLLLNSIYVYTKDEFDAGTSCAYVEMFIDGQVQFVKLNVHNFFTQRRTVINNHLPGGGVAVLSDPLDEVKDFKLFKTSRLLLQ